MCKRGDGAWRAIGNLLFGEAAGVWVGAERRARRGLGCEDVNMGRTDEKEREGEALGDVSEPGQRQRTAKVKG